MRLRRLLGSTFGRMLAGYAAVTLLLAGAWLWSLSQPLMNAVIAQQERNLTAVAQSASLLVGESSKPPQQIAKQLVARTDLRMTLVSATGVVLADSHYDPAKMSNHANRPEIRAALTGSLGVDRRKSATEGNEQIYVAVPAIINGSKAVVRVSQPLDDVQAIAAKLRRFGLLLLAIALVAALAIIWRATRFAAKPIRELSDASRQMAQGNLSVPIPSVPSDLEGLAMSLGMLRDQIKTRIEDLDAERLTLRHALDGLTDAVLVLDGTDIELANRSACSLFKLPESPRNNLALDESPLPASVSSAVVRQLQSADRSWVDLEPDPTGRALRLLVAPLPGSATEKRSIAIISDVTERVRLDHIRRDFVANASHELKTPVSGIKLLAGGTIDALSDGDLEQARAFTSQIAEETTRLQRLVMDLLELSRLESLPAPDAITDMRVAIDNALVSHRLAADTKGLALAADLSRVAGVDVFVSADPTDIAVALDNLIDNAIAYSDEGGVTVTMDVEDSAVLVKVSDTGPGIAPEHLPRMFERFYRIDRGRSRDSGGTGLGLALVRHVVERNGGDVSATSEVGVGTTFTLRLPRAKNPMERSRA